jgi:hypothetical protein
MPGFVPVPAGSGALISPKICGVAAGLFYCALPKGDRSRKIQENGFLPTLTALFAAGTIEDG